MEKSLWQPKRARSNPKIEQGFKGEISAEIRTFLGIHESSPGGKNRDNLRDCIFGGTVWILVDNTRGIIKGFTPLLF